MRMLRFYLFVVCLFSVCTPALAAQMSSTSYLLRDAGTTNGAMSATSYSYNMQGNVRNEDGATSGSALYVERGGVWSRVQRYTINFASGGNGSITGDTSQTVNNNESTTAVTAVPNTGYHFVNWTGSDGFATTTTNPLTISNVAANMTITANYAADQYTVIATTGAALSITTTTATLSGTVSSNGAATSVTFDYGTTAIYGQSAAAVQSPLPPDASGSTVSAAISGLTCNTTYHYRVVGQNSFMATNGSDAIFTTAACPNTILPTINISSPSLTLTKNSDVTYTVTYSGADSVTLADANITLNKSGSTNGTATVSGSGTTTRTVTISGISGTGTLGISIASGTASDTAGNTALASGASTTFTVDNTAPAISSTSPATGSFINQGQGSYTLSEAVASGNITFTRTGGAADTSSPRVYTFTAADMTSGSHSIQNITLQNGTVYTVTFDAADAAGNSASQVVATTVMYDTTGATASLTAPTAGSRTNTSAVTYTLNEAIGTGSLTFTRTGGTADGSSPHSYQLAGTELTSGSHTVNTGKTLVDGTIYTVSFDGIADLAGNSSATVSNSNVTFDTTSVAITAVSPAASGTINAASVNFTLSEAARSGTITFTRTGGTADASSPHSYTMQAGDLTIGVHTAATGLTLVDGALYTLSIEAMDLVGNPATTVSVANVTVDTTAPTVSIGSPSLTLTKNSDVTYTVTYSGADSVTLADANITLNKSGSTNGTATVSGSGSTTRTVTISGISGTGTLGISIAAGTASDTAGNTALASGASTTFTVDNTAPTVSIGSPSLTLTKNSNVTYTVTYSGADSVTLADVNITLNKSGSTNGTATVSGSGSTTRTVTISGISGTGTLGISIASGTASDTAGNTALASGASATFVIDNSGPTLTLSSLADGSVTNNATLNITGTVSDSESGAKSVTVNGTPATITAGSFSIAITLAGGANSITITATDNSDNTTSISRTVTLDSMAPGLTITQPADNIITGNTSVDVTGSVDDATATVTAKINGGSAISATMSGTDFRLTLNLIAGLNTIDITATDVAGNSSSVKRTVTSDSSEPSLSVSSPAQDISTAQSNFIISGRVTDTDTSSTVSITVEGQTYTPTIAPGGDFTQTINLPTDMTYAVIVTATDQAGNQAMVQRNIIKSTTTPNGDINGDGVVDVADALKVLRIAVGLDIATSYNYATADVAPLSDGIPAPDGVINIADALVILEKAVGLKNW